MVILLVMDLSGRMEMSSGSQHKRVQIRARKNGKGIKWMDEKETRDDTSESRLAF